MYLAMLFKLDTQIMNDSLHMPVIFFRDQVQHDQLVAILLLKYVPNHFSDMYGLFLFKLRKSTVHHGIHMHLTLFCDLIKDG